jgi:hypothetical protein
VDSQRLSVVRPSDDERIAQLEGRVKALAGEVEELKAAQASDRERIQRGEDARRRRAWLEGAVYVALGVLSLLRMFQR